MRLTQPIVATGGVFSWAKFEVRHAWQVPSTSSNCGARVKRLIPGLGEATKSVRVSSYNSEALLHSLTMTTRRLSNNDRWDDKEEASSQGGKPNNTPAFKSLTREEAQALRDREPSLSPWRVIGTQAAVGVVMALLVALFAGEKNWTWSVLYGAATVVVPGALMARGMTSRLSSMNPGTSAVSFMAWEMLKIGVSVAMLVLAPKLVQPLSWPALLVSMVVCMKVYWIALLWRGQKK
jgi:ATP synthase protein I